MWDKFLIELELKAKYKKVNLNKKNRSGIQR